LIKDQTVIIDKLSVQYSKVLLQNTALNSVFCCFLKKSPR